MKKAELKVIGFSSNDVIATSGGPDDILYRFQKFSNSEFQDAFITRTDGVGPLSFDRYLADGNTTNEAFPEIFNIGANDNTRVYTKGGGSHLVGSLFSTDDSGSTENVDGLYRYTNKTFQFVKFINQ